jgi:hypothetical protein
MAFFWMLKARVNDGSSAPQLINNLMEGEENSYIHALHGTLAENRQRLINIEVPSAGLSSGRCSGHSCTQ